MHRSPNDIWILGGVVGFVLSLQFRFGWKVLGYILFAAFKAIRWVIILGLLIGVLICPQMYLALGWTPMSFLLGDRIYDQALHRGGYAPHATRSAAERLQRPAVGTAESEGRLTVSDRGRAALGRR